MNIPDDFFLTKKLKQQMLVNLNNKIKNKEIDEHMVPYLRKINKINGLMSQFCCEGHTVNDCDGLISKYFSEYGNLLILLSKNSFKKLYITPRNFDYHMCCVGVESKLDFFNDTDIGGEKHCRIILRFHFSNRDEVLNTVLNYFNVKLGKEKWKMK